MLADWRSRQESLQGTALIDKFCLALVSLCFVHTDGGKCCSALVTIKATPVHPDIIAGQCSANAVPAHCNGHVLTACEKDCKRCCTGCAIWSSIQQSPSSVLNLQ